MLKKGWDYKMNKYVKEYLKIGFMFSGIGPVVAGIIYLILEKTGVSLNLSGFDVFLAIITTYIMAFVQAGASTFNRIEHWGKAKSLFWQMSTIYVVYIGGYLINRWIPLDWKVIIIFTSIYIASYLIVWLFVYFIIKKESKKLNQRLIEKQQELSNI